MKKLTLSLLFFTSLFFPNDTFSSLNQNCTTYDSLLLLVNKTNDRQQVDVLIGLAKVVNDTAPENSFAFAMKALNIATASGYNKGKADARLLIGKYLMVKRKYVPALQFFLGALPIYHKINDQTGLLESFRSLGLLYLQLKSYNNALIFFQQGLSMARSIRNVSWIGLFLHNIGIIRQQEGHFQDAYVLYNQALSSFQQIGQRNSELEVYNSLGSLLLDQKKYDEALNLYVKILNLNKEMPFPFLGTIYTRLAHIYSQKNQLLRSLEFNKKALVVRLQSRQFEEANSSLINVSGSYFDLNKKDSAWKYMNEGLYQARKYNRKNLLENAFYILYSHFITTRDFSQALEYYQQYEAIGDSIQQDKTRSEITIVDAKQRILNLNECSDLLLKQHEIQRLSLRNQRNQLIFLKALTGISIIFTLVFLLQFIKNLREKKKLQVLNDQLSREIHDREITQSQSRDREKKYRFITEHTADLIARIDNLSRCTYASPSAEKIFGFTPSEILSEMPYKITHPDFIEHAEKQLQEMIQERKPRQFSYLALRKNGEQFWAEGMFNPVFEKETGKFREVVCIMRDIQELKNKEMEIIEGTKQKENLLKEIHHRVKNNFAILVSLINMQKDQTQSPELIQSLTNLQLRIRTMALVHEMLYRSKDFEKISFSEYLRSLSAVITGTYDSRKIQVHFEVEEIVMDIEASIPLGLIVNEILSNAYKHAFPDERSGNIWIKLNSHANKSDYCLIIHDDGIGMPEGFIFENSRSMGLQIVQILVKQIEGKVEIENKHGSLFAITFPKSVN